jgi:2-dehydro-3-deoxyphosphogluconate aldolase/(4S)-4-hydroxy-2-oxoglutarate aldolase
MHAVLEKLGNIGIIPVIKIDDTRNAIPLAKALAEGGIPCIEITFRTAEGEEAIRRIAKEMPETLIGAGTVLTVDQADRAVNAGAQFIVSPGLNPKVVAHCIQKGVPVIPGCANPSDIEQALEFDLEFVKFFPAEQAGGLEYIKAISAPYPNLKFIPTGGINANNIAKYTSFDKVHACGGSWMAGADLINAGGFEKITAMSHEAVLSMLGFEFAHLGINAKGDGNAAKHVAQFFGTLFGFPLKDGAQSVFAGTDIEVVKADAPGAYGHIAIATNSIAKAVFHLERASVIFNYANAEKDPKGALLTIYLKEEVLGFAIHLVRK